jgi:DNA-binding NarL/FixJ family response regulator
MKEVHKTQLILAESQVAKPVAKPQHFLAGPSDQEAEIARLWLEGHGTDEIATQIKLAPSTVRKWKVMIRDAAAAAFNANPDE